VAPRVAVTPFSHFSAVSELFVTAGVFYFFWQAVKHGNYRWSLIAIVITFETVFNITYMAARMAQAAPATERPGWATALMAGHGTLSLLMFLGLIAFVLLGYRAARVENANLFRSHIGLTWTFVVLWSLSILSGEALYVLQLTGHLRI
jgi:hypothetical protein